jgi:hypothetical protein
MMKRSICLLTVFVSFVFISTTATAVMEDNDPSINLMWGEDGTGNTWMDGMNETEFVPNGDGSFTLTAGTVTDRMELTGCEINLQMTYDPDPYVDAVFGVKNTLLVDQTFTFTYTAPVIPALTPSTLYGGTFSGSVSSLDGGSLSAVSGTGLFEAFIDDDLVLSYYTSGETWTVSGLGSTTIPGNDWDITNVGPAADTDITMVYTFTLSPGELASFNGRFDVVPEPATLVLLGLGALLLRRKK